MPLALADSFDVSVPDTILAIDNTVSIPLTITNMQAFDDKYTISVLDFNWLVESIDNTEILQGQTKVINVNLKSSYPEVKNYGIKIKIKSLSNQEIEKIARVDVKDLSDVFKITLLGPEIIDPRKDTKFNLQIESPYDNNFGELNIIIKSDAFTETKTIELDSRAIIKEEFNINLPIDTQEGDHTANIMFYKDNNLVANQTIILTIGSYSGVREILTNDNSILIKKEIVKKINDGNSIGFEKYVKTLTLTEKLFTTTTPKPDDITKSNGNYILTWNIKLNPGEEQDIEIETNYRIPLIILILAIGLIILLYFMLRRDVIIIKKALVSGRHKGVSKLKMIITLYNKGNKKITNMKLMERIPNVTEDPNDFSEKPFKITKGNTLNLVWKIDELNPKEERTISYRYGSRSLVKKLPETMAQYVQGSRTVVSKSSRIKLR